MNDNELLEQFETATLHPFRHREHIQIAWLFLRRDGWEEGYKRIQSGLKHFVLAHGASQKYHETITCFWASLVQHCIDEHPEIDEFDVFVANFPILLDQSAMSQHYSADLLLSKESREFWQVPDLMPMPPR